MYFYIYTYINNESIQKRVAEQCYAHDEKSREFESERERESERHRARERERKEMRECDGDERTFMMKGREKEQKKKKNRVTH